jgi:hypothetical protein
MDGMRATVGSAQGSARSKRGSRAGFETNLHDFDEAPMTAIILAAERDEWVDGGSACALDRITPTIIRRWRPKRT